MQTKLNATYEPKVELFAFMLRKEDECNLLFTDYVVASALATE